MEFCSIFPKTTFITNESVCDEYARKFRVLIRGKHKRKTWKPFPGTHHKRGITLLSPMILLDLLNLRPDIVITPEFNLWTLFALIAKKWGGWKVTILIDGPSKSVEARHSKTRTLVRKIMARMCDSFVTNSHRTISYLKEFLDADEKKLHRIIYYQAYRRMRNSSNYNSSILCLHNSSKCNFIYVGRLIPLKGIWQLLIAWSLLPPEKSQKARLVIVGDGESKQDLMRTKEKLGLSNVFFVGNVDYGSLDSWYLNSDVFVFPSLEDTWGVVVCEAMSAGNAVLCSKHAGVSELIVHGECGFIFDPHSTEELCNYIRFSIENPEKIDMFGSRANELIGPHTPRKAAISLKDVIKKISIEWK